jgi:hypothetical protein
MLTAGRLQKAPPACSRKFPLEEVSIQGLKR